MVERKEIEITKQIVKKYSLPEKILKDDLKKYLVKEGLSPSSANNYIFVLEALDLIKENPPFITLDKKLFEAIK